MHRKNKERVRAWVAALRSGVYEQTRGELRDKNGFCCLGVACDIYNRETGKGSWCQRPDGVVDFIDGAAERSVGILTDEVRRWFGLRACNGSYGIAALTHNRGYALSDLNDGGASFGEIADIIEREPTGLFI